MKRFRMFSLTFAVVLVLGLSFTACSTDGEGGGGNSGGFAKTNWRSVYNIGVVTMEMKLSFLTSVDWAMYMNDEVTGAGWTQFVAGTYTVSGGTAMLSSGSEGLVGKATISGNMMTLIGMLANYGGNSWTRE